MKTYTTEVPVNTVITDDGDVLRSVAFEPPRRRWPGMLATAVIGAGIAAFAVSSIYDDRTVGQKLDSAVAVSGQKIDQTVGDLKGATADGSLATTLGDAGITASVKTALAADPALSALKIDVTTNNGVVSLSGPAPDESARERAEVLAAAPEGVTRVDNQLLLPPSKSMN